MNSTFQITDNSRPESSALDIGTMALDILENDHPTKRRRSPSESLPPLEQITVCSDDDSCASSVSCLEDQPVISEKRSRSIFNKFWEKEGGTAALRREPSLPANLTDTAIKFDLDVSSSVYERILHHQERTCKIPSDVGGRRSIFNKSCWSQSMPSLALSGRDSRNLRKSQSALALRPKNSCLRQNRFSRLQFLGDDSEDSSKSSVRFNLNVDVKVFTPPTEIWAATGWSDYFA